MTELQFPEFVYVPAYGLTGVAYQACTPPNGSWKKDDYGPNTAVFDTETIHALDRIATGPVTSWDQIDAAELALRSLILHERLYWLLPAVLIVTPESTVKGNGPPVVQDSGRVIYPKYDEPQAFMDVLQSARASSYSVFSAWVYVKDGQPVGGHEFWIQNYERLRSTDESSIRQVFKESFQIPYFRDSYFSSPKAIGSGAYFGLPEHRQYESDLMHARGSVFPENVLRKMDDAWREDICGASIGLNVRLGPFLSIVLSRAPSRDRIPQIVIELRNEFQEMRTEFWELFSVPLNERRLPVAVRKIRELQRAIDSIVPAAFPRKERPFRFWWDTTHVIAEIIQTGGALSALKYAGDLLLNRDLHFAQVSTVGVTKKITRELKKMDHSLVHQLRKHLIQAELHNLGIL